MLCQETLQPPRVRMPARRPVAAPPENLLPRSFLAWLPFLWSRVLFPGQPEPLQRGRWASLLIVGVVSGAMLYPCLSFFLFEPDEGRYAQIPREMLTRGDWLVPSLQGEPYLDKPPLFYWLVMSCYQVLGYHDWAARLVPALAVQGCIVLTYLLGARLLGERPAFWGALMLALLPGFMGMGRLLVLDGLLTFWVTLSIYCAACAVAGPKLRHGWWLAAALACGLGVLTKGPIALALLLPPLWLHRRLVASQAPIGRRAWLFFVGVVLVVTLPWYVAVCVRMPEFAQYFLWVHNVQRFVQPFDHIRPVWFYVPIMLIGLLPATALLVPCARFLVAETTASKRCPALGYLLLSAGWCLLFFSLSGCKLPTYVLPAFPPLALALGVYLAQSPLRRTRWFQSGLVTWGVLSCVGHGILLPAVARARSPMADTERLQTLCGDPRVPVICFPRHVDSVAFYVGRADFQAIHTRHVAQLLARLDQHPRTVVLFGHRHSLESLKHFLPPHLHIVDTAPMGLCDLGVVERRVDR